MIREFVETTIFSSEWKALGQTDAGPVIEGTGGARKMRWAREGRTGGKRGGLRVVYWDDSGSGILFLLVVFAKKEKSDLTPAEKKVLKDFIRIL